MGIYSSIKLPALLIDSIALFITEITGDEIERVTTNTNTVSVMHFSSLFFRPSLKLSNTE